MQRQRRIIHSWEGQLIVVVFGGLSIQSLLFAGDVILLASWSSDLELVLGWFAANVKQYKWLTTRQFFFFSYQIFELNVCNTCSSG